MSVENIPAGVKSTSNGDFLSKPDRQTRLFQKCILNFISQYRVCLDHMILKWKQAHSLLRRKMRFAMLLDMFRAVKKKIIKSSYDLKEQLVEMLLQSDDNVGEQCLCEWMEGRPCSH